MATSEIRVFPVPHSATPWRSAPAAGVSPPHDGDGLCRERCSQQFFNPMGNCIVELLKCWILLENALSQKRRVTSPVVVDRGRFWHGSPLKEAGRKTKASKQGKLRKRGDNTHAVDSVTTLAGSLRVSTFRFGRNRCTSAEINCLQCDRRKRRTDPVCRSYGVSGKDRLIRDARTRRSDKVNELAQVLYAGLRLSCIAGSF